jgi:hypothetical protein
VIVKAQEFHQSFKVIHHSIRSRKEVRPRLMGVAPHIHTTQTSLHRKQHRSRAAAGVQLRRSNCHHDGLQRACQCHVMQATR